jgi:hypothetical protein
MPACRLCGASFPNWLRIDGSRPRNLSNRKYCFACSPRGTHNTRVLEDSTRVRAALPPDTSPTKTCPRCRTERPNADFYLRPDGHRSYSWCRPCNNQHRIARFRQDRYQALFHYSGGDIRCACCGERTIEFLALDHVNNDGAAHRRELRTEGGGRFYAWLRRTGYSYTSLAVSCHNCNIARSFYGRCPHQTPP